MTRDPSKPPGKVQKSAPWVALASAAIIPFFSYLESSSRAREAEAKARQVQVIQQTDHNEVTDTTTAVMSATTEVTDRLQADITACHQRVDKLAQAMEEIATSRRRTTTAPAAIMEQRTLASERPAAKPMPRRKSDVDPDDPLAGALK